MKAEQTLLDIRDALREFDFSTAKTVLEKHCNEYLVWAVDNYSRDFEGFSINQYNNGQPPGIWVGRHGSATEILLKDFYELFNKENGNK